jgi:hypothetical protein
MLALAGNDGFELDAVLFRIAITTASPSTHRSPGSDHLLRSLNSAPFTATARFSRRATLEVRSKGHTATPGAALGVK